MSDAHPRVRATITRWIAADGYGFARILDDALGRSVYVNASDVDERDLSAGPGGWGLARGDVIECEVQPSPRRLPRAVAVRVIA